MKWINVLLIPAGSVTVKKRKDFLSLNTLARLQKCLEIWPKINQEYDFLALSGGIFVRGQKTPASVLMYEWLIKKIKAKFPISSISNVLILREKKSLNTYQNIEFIVKIFEQKGYKIKKLGLISQKKHLKRIILTAHFYGIKNVVAYPVNYPKESLLEYILILVHLFDPGGKGPISKLNQKIRKSISQN